MAAATTAAALAATLEPVLRARLRDDLDLLALAVHCCLTAAGWTLDETGTAGKASRDAPRRRR
jgi:hypothetical protein